MAEKFISMRNLQFLLYEHLDSVALTQYPYFADHSRETFDMVLETAMRMGRGILFPALSEMDKKPPEFKDGKVFVHPVVAIVMKACGEGGWIGAQASYESGGQQIPNTIMTAFRGIFSAANYSASVYPFLTTGAAHLILSFGAKELVDTYVPKMFAGPVAGDDGPHGAAGGLVAHGPHDDGLPDRPTATYKIKGQKIFISCADYESTENVVNLLLARIDGAPPGIKGISLFVVPKKRPDGQGTLVANDVTCIGIYHKLGYRGAPITQLAFGDNDDCRGWLVGEPHKGLRYMFQMMNEARIDVGMGAAAIASAAYYAALEYAKAAPAGPARRREGPPGPADPDHRARRREADAPLPARRRRGVARAPLPVRPVRGPRPGDRRGGEGAIRAAPRPPHAGRQDLPLGDGDPLREPGAPVPRRLRLLRRVPAGAVLPRHPDPSDPRGDDRDPGHGPPGPEGRHEKREGLLFSTSRSWKRPSPPAGRSPSAPPRRRRSPRPWRRSRR